jgi:hypothetical protein
MRAIVVTGAVVAALAASAACGGGKDPAVCRREAHALGELLSTMDYEMPPFYAGDATLVLRTDVPVTAGRYGPTIVITRDGATLDGMPLGDLVVRRRLEDAHDRRAMVYVAVDEAAPWSEVQAVVHRLVAADLMHPSFGFARPATPVTRPPRSKIDDELDRLQNGTDSSHKATDLAKMVQEIVKGCPAIIKVFGEVAVESGESKAARIVRAIEPSLVACNCNLDLPAFRSVMFRLLYVEKAQSALEITLDPEATPLVLPPDTPWRDANAKLTPGAHVWIPAP